VTDWKESCSMDQAQILETLKSNFLFNFRTGNVMVDTVVTGLIIMMSTYLLNLSQQLFSIDWSGWMTKRWKKEARIVISGRKLQGSHNTRLEYSTNFFAILHQIKKLDCVEADIMELSEVPIQEPDQVSYDYDQDSECDANDGSSKSRGLGTNLIVSQSAPFRMTDHIQGQVNISKETDNNEKNPMKTEEFTIVLSSPSLTTDQLRQSLGAWVAEYEARINSDKHLKYFVYTPSNDSNDDYYDATSHYQEFRFESGKSFSNVFYPEKDDVVKRLDFFAANKDWYKKRGIPYTMGFLFYGAPGCGKTSTIKAMANHTQRHIVSVPLNKIKTAKELLNVFYNVKMNYKEIPLHQRLYVLEDIDAADLKDVVGERSKGDDGEKKEGSEGGEKEDTDSGIDMNLLQLLKSSATMGPLDKWKSSKLTLATLLEVLDGVMEMDGRMLVITTNYPERLDKALIRPGRIDMKVKFGPCTAENVLQMYQHYFETEIPSSFDPSSLQDGQYTPAEVTQVFLNNMADPEVGLRQLAAQTATNIRLEEGCSTPENSAKTSAENSAENSAEHSSPSSTESTTPSSAPSSPGKKLCKEEEI